MMDQQDAQAAGLEIKARRYRFIVPETGLPMTQRDFAVMCDISHSNLTQTERGGRSQGVNSRSYIGLITRSLNWIEIQHGLVPWEALSEARQKFWLDLAQTVMRIYEIDAHSLDAKVERLSDEVTAVLFPARKRKGRAASGAK